MTEAEKTSDPMSPFARPYPATMRPTSPREIIPMPTRTDSLVEKPKSRANTPQPMALATIATSTSTTVNIARGPSSRPLASRPMLMKNSGTKIE